MIFPGKRSSPEGGNNFDDDTIKADGLEGFGMEDEEGTKVDGEVEEAADNADDLSKLDEVDE
ncbi:MAG: hypothetical protein Q7S66_00475 [bacterium]|nr:hypothetical protein [bacterium]